MFCTAAIAWLLCDSKFFAAFTFGDVMIDPPAPADAAPATDDEGPTLLRRILAASAGTLAARKRRAAIRIEKMDMKLGRILGRTAQCL
jgi:hypothetical protein